MTITVIRPETLEEAVTLLAVDGDALVYGGGTALQILRKQGILFASSLVDISAIPLLGDLTDVGGALRVGAMVSLRRMERDPMVGRHAPLACAAYGEVANPRVRNTASVGGNIAHGDYRLDPPVALLVLGAMVELASVEGSRRVPIEDFFVDFQRTAIGPGELVTAVEIPAPRAPIATSYVKLSSLSANDWPSASAAVGIVEEGTRRSLRLALGALAPTAVLAELDVTGADLPGALDASLDAAMALMEPIPDVRGGVEYKRHLGRVAVEDAVTRAWRELTHGEPAR